MTTPLSPLPPVRRLRLADLNACLDLAESHRWSREEHKWRLLLTAGQGYGVDDPEGNGLIATVVVTSYAGRHHAVGMMLVAAAHQRRGLGSQVLRHALEDCGPSVIFLTATPAGQPLYQRLGFKTAGSVTTLRGGFTGAVPAPAPPGITLRPATAADLPAVLAYDLPAFGADRTGLLARLPSFADRFLVAEGTDGRLAGYAASWPNVSDDVIGPVLADDQHLARALIARLGTASSRAIRFDADPRHHGLEQWLRACGLSGDTTCALMVRGAPTLPGDPTRRFAPYSVALG